MNALKYGFGLILVGGFALTASCSGSSNDSSSSGGTSSSTGGTSSSTGGTVGNPGGGTFGNPSGGTFGNPSGGRSNPSGGTGNPNGGTGTAGTGNPAGGNGAGGATMNPASCPPATPTPMTGDACTVATVMQGMPRPACVYGNTSCTCRPMQGGPGGGQAGAAAAGDGTLRCGPLPAMCPAASSTPPTDGSACTGNIFNCRFDTGERCSCFNMQWNCRGGMGAAGAGG